MSTYIASMLQEFNGVCSTVCGSFGNIQVDGRLNMHTAKLVARRAFQKESAHKNTPYIGFVIQKVQSGWKYTNPEKVDVPEHITSIKY